MPKIKSIVKLGTIGNKQTKTSENPAWTPIALRRQKQYTRIVLIKKNYFDLQLVGRRKLGNRYIKSSEEHYFRFAIISLSIEEAKDTF